MVTVKVGRVPNQRTFSVHKALLVHHSDYFAAALGQNWQEGQDNVVTLDHDDGNVFKAFFDFLYKGKIYTQPGTEDDTIRVGEDHGREWKMLQDLWVFGESRMSTSFKDAAVDAMIAKVLTDGELAGERIVTIYYKSTTSSAIRRLLIDFEIWARGPGNLVCFTQPTHPSAVEVLHDIAVALDKIKISGRKGRALYESENTCAYHEHVAEKKACYKTMF
jgi:hypothetical protein